MTFNVIATGSKGNAVVINDSILIDCGVPFKALEPVKKDLKLVLLTHVHGDHFKPRAVRALHKERPTLRFCCCEWMVEPLLKAGVSKEAIYLLDLRTTYKFLLLDETIFISPEPLVHDVKNCGYHVFMFNRYIPGIKYEGGERLFYATDTATLDGINAPGYDLYLIEANHKRDELEARAKAKRDAGEYAYEYRAAENHLSEEQALDWLYQQMGPKSQYVFLHQHKDHGR